MERRTLLALALSPLASVSDVTDKKEEKVEDKCLTQATIDWFENTLVIPGNRPDDSDLSEIIARLGWVLLGKPLSALAKSRTIARANSLRPDRIPFVRMDMASPKRALCVIISLLDDHLKKPIDANQKQ